MISIERVSKKVVCKNLCIQKNNIFLEIGQALADDHAAVMVGAGFSKNAEKISTAGREFLNWNQLSDLFYEKLYGDSEYPGKNYCSSLRLAEEVEIMVGRPGLEKNIKAGSSG